MIKVEVAFSSFIFYDLLFSASGQKLYNIFSKMLLQKQYRHFQSYRIDRDNEDDEDFSYYSSSHSTCTKAFSKCCCLKAVGNYICEK